ncbi:MAG: hypothetical protein EXS33_03495 [Pedosphaera sp.]|nr:hypothetical protein [Pedosphaera sp.]
MHLACHRKTGLGTAASRLPHHRAFQKNLLILSDTGELQLVKADPKKFQLKGRFQAVGRTTRTCPALADGFAYIKGPRQLVCVDLRAVTPWYA